VLEKEHAKSIIQHEVGTYPTRHSWDLLFFELIRNCGLVLSPGPCFIKIRVSELHDSIADAKVGQDPKAEQVSIVVVRRFSDPTIFLFNQSIF